MHAGAGTGTMLLAGWLVRTNNLTVGISLILVGCPEPMIPSPPHKPSTDPSNTPPHCFFPTHTTNQPQNHPPTQQPNNQAVFGQGSDLMVLSGGAVLVFNRVVTRPPALLYFNPGLYGVWIAGNGFYLARPDMLVRRVSCPAPPM